MEFTVNLKAEEYRQAMLWHQFAGTLGRRLNDFIGWSILVLTPLTIAFLLLFAPDALTIWFWPVAIIATAYAIYSTLIIRYQIHTQAAALLAQHPALLHTTYLIHDKGMKLTTAADDEEKLFLPWKEIQQVRETKQSYLFFVEDERLLIVPRRTLPDEERFRAILRAAGKLA